jgi:hypothetical protein
LNELDEKPNQTKISKSSNFEGKGYKAKDSFFKPFDKKKCSTGSKCLALDARHVQEIILPKNMFAYPLKLILGFLGIFYVFGIKQKYSYTIMYECEKSPLTHELFYIGIFNYFSFKFVSCKC